MNKQIAFSLLILSSTLSYGMEPILHNNDLLSCLTEGLCFSHSYNPKTLKQDIRTLSDTNKSFHDYYAQEKVAQNIIRLCSYHLPSNDQEVAQGLKCRTITKKIRYFVSIAQNRRDEYLWFPQQALKDQWYLNVTRKRFDVHADMQYEPLLRTAFNNNQFKTAHTILDNAKPLQFQYHNTHTNLLCDIVDQLTLYYYRTDPLKEEMDEFLSLARRILLQKNPVADNAHKQYCCRALILAVRSKCKEMVRVLLEGGVDPYAKHYDKDGNEQDTFHEVRDRDMAWFKIIIAEVEASKKAKIAPQQTDQSV